MYSIIYSRLLCHVSASNRQVIRAAQATLNDAARYGRPLRVARHEFYKAMLQEHAKHRGLVQQFRL